MNVGDLKRLLANVPDDLEVGAADHFGKFVLFQEGDFWVNDGLLAGKKFFEINPPYVGEEPE